MKSATPSRTGRPIRAAAAIHGGLIRIKDASFDRVQGAAGDLFCAFQALRICVDFEQLNGRRLSLGQNHILDLDFLSRYESLRDFGVQEQLIGR